MNEEIDDSEFYHEDFTTASDWEILVAHVEEIVNQWHCDDRKQSPSPELWKVRSEKLVYMETNFDFTYYQRQFEENVIESPEDTSKHVLDKWFDFSMDTTECHKDSCLVQWFGLNDFIVLSSSGNVEHTNNETRLKILLSTVSVLAGNMLQGIPIFVQVRDKWQKMYCGVYECNGIRTNFDVVHLKRSPYHCQYLTGLLDVFKTKIRSPCSIENIFVSLKATYELQDFGSFLWKQDCAPDSIDIETIFILPFGVTIDPVNTLYLNALWSNLSEHSVIDSENHTDFRPLKAQKWHCSASFTKEPICLLGDCIGEVLEILNNDHTVYDLLGSFAVLHAAPEHNPLDVLTESAVPTISMLLGQATRNSKGNPPLQTDVLLPLLFYLFPDADQDSSFPYGAKDDKEPQKKFKVFENVEQEFKGFKTCAEDSLVWRLSIVLSNALQSLGGLKAFCHLWYEFVQEMRYRWDKSILIPGVPPGLPDLRTSLLNQKLQMLNCCLERKIARSNLSYASAENSEDSDDEFFDATDHVYAEERKKEKYSLWDRPVGRLSTFGNAKLIKTGDPLYIPFTQDPVLKTEDQLEEDTDILLKLGSDNEASELRARIMSASLFSDMESFKAANPGAVLEDFIRWYSPRDWIEEEELDEYGQKRGALSQRMQLEGNIWTEMWHNSKPVPAHRQKRLFDDTREAEKALQFLDLRSIGQIAELILPILSHAAISRLIDEVESLTEDIAEDLRPRTSSLIKHCERISRDVKLQPKRFEAFMQETIALEMAISQFNSLQYKLNPQGVDDHLVQKCIRDLAAGRTIHIQGKEQSLIGSRIALMLKETQRRNSRRSSTDSNFGKNEDLIFPDPVSREFVLRANCVRPSLHSAKCPQLLRAILGKGEIRFVGAFSEDTIFY